MSAWGESPVVILIAEAVAVADQLQPRWRHAGALLDVGPVSQPVSMTHVMAFDESGHLARTGATLARCLK